jgi:uncharacterized protein YkwD
VPKSLVVLCLTALCIAMPGAAHAAGKSAAEPDPIIEQINEARQSHGLRPLLHSPSLSRTAERFADGLMRADRFSHDARIHVRSRFARLGETLAIHPGWRPQRGLTVRHWLRSAAHRALLLSRSFTHVGAGMSRGRFGRGFATIWTIQLGAR